MKKNYKISGSGVLCVEDDMITICLEDGEYNLAKVISDLDGREVKFNFSYDEDYPGEDEELMVDPESGEVI